MKLYKDRLMDHFQNPRNKGKLENPDFSTAQHNPSCGDSVSVQGVVKDNVLSAIAFEGKGCVMSQAAASILSEFCISKTVDEILAIQKEDLPEIIGMEIGPIRIKCALLALIALKDGILQYKKR